MDMKFFYFILFVMFFASCVSDGNKDGDVEIPIDSLFNEKPLLISDEAMEDIIQNISSPVEMAALLKATGVPFSKKYLCSTDKLDNLNTNFKRALNLGVYGADLGYLNMYNKTGSVLTNMSAIKRLSEALSIGQFFDFSTIKRLATNNENLDSLMYISVASFNNMDEYLRKNNRSNLSSLIVFGVWIEGLYIATQVIRESTDNAEVVERIGEQKLILNDILLILKNYKSDKNFYNLIEDVEKIKKEFEGVTITYEMGEPIAVEIDGMLMIQQTSSSNVTVSPEQLNNIIDIVEKVRNKLISL
ncbi:MAG: hypothetical protein KAT68_03160 [Bacteroidales bacterium]|nr:hypothetical protein [Bacteroidales bacterium]